MIKGLVIASDKPGGEASIGVEPESELFLKFEKGRTFVGRGELKLLVVERSTGKQVTTIQRKYATEPGTNIVFAYWKYGRRAFSTTRAAYVAVCKDKKAKYKLHPSLRDWEQEIKVS